ncbi:hypothetical protein CLF_107917 [Clonorchis sinensis]|uniref:C2H2-type domain-containing protein n=1 Tax=Clonorchis sinensis TaxID=79923 RepID=G7YR52_CLOSI|nr:hypothetical protein CLF_107917 [Clonorchis sinensis]
MAVDLFDIFSALKLSPRMVTKRLQANRRARQTDQEPPDQTPTNKKVPVRPMVDGTGSSPHELARFLASILKLLTGKSSSYNKNSYDFANKVAGVTVEPDDILVNLDVNSLYTNVPKGDSLDRAKRLLLADTTLSERRTQLTVFWRYVDDTFVVMKRDEVSEFYNYLNELSPHIKLSMEIELTSGTLAFLDCMTHKIGVKLKTTVFEKPTDTGTLLNYSSASITSSLFKCVRAPCTEEVDRTAAQIALKNKLRGSGYPSSLIRRQLRRVLVPVANPKREWLGTAIIPYKPGTWEVIRRILRTANIRVAFQTGSTLRFALMQLKDHFPTNRTRDCVYKIKCNDCTKEYTGQTAKEHHTRILGHKRKINRPPRNADEYRTLLKDSAVAEHALDTRYKIDFENVEVLRRGLRSS